TLMRGEDGGLSPLPDGLRQHRRLVGKARQRIGIEDHGAPRGQRRKREIPRVLPDTNARAEDERIAPWIGEEFAKLTRIVDRSHHHREARRRVDRKRLAWAGEGDEPGTRPQGAARGKPRRARRERGP